MSQGVFEIGVRPADAKLARCDGRRGLNRGAMLFVAPSPIESAYRQEAERADLGFSSVGWVVSTLSIEANRERCTFAICHAYIGSFKRCFGI